MREIKKSDILFAVLGVIFFFFMTVVFNKCSASDKPSEWYTTVGFGFTQDDNVFCLHGDTLGAYGIIAFGYRLDESLAVQYRHNSCIDKEHDEGSLDGIELLFEFK